MYNKVGDVMKKNMAKAFFITVGILLLTFLILGIYPFGNKTVVVIDSNTQYVTFLSYLKSILLTNNDFKYTFSATLGENMIPLIGYYLMSIFNLFVIFFRIENIKILFTILILVKIGLCAVTMEYYLEKKYKKNTLIFSICYALMTYNIVYMYHIMWLDSIMLFPLVILGLDYIFENKSAALYIFALALSIICNYYIGFIICIASVMYFVYKFVFQYKNINIKKTIINYIIASLSAGMLSAFILIPSVLGLMGGKLMTNNIDAKFNLSYLNVIAEMYSASTGVNAWHAGPMVASSVLTLLLIIIYFINKNVDKKEKIINGVSLFILATTFVFNPLCILFHGLTNPNCFNYRHAFIFVFFALNLAIRSYNEFKIDKKTIRKSSYIFIILSLIILVCQFEFNTITYNISIIISLILGIWYLYALKNKRSIITYLVIIDLLINSISGVLLITLSDKQYMDKYKNYVKDVSEVINSIDDDSFYRVEKTFDRESNKSMLSINDSMIFNYNSISHFDSTTKESTEKLLESLGQRKLLTRAYYNDSTYLLDSIFGIKYVLSKDEYKNYKLINENNGIKLYENPYYLSLGYKVNNINVDFSNDPFYNENEMIKAFTGLDSNIYKMEKYTLTSENVEINNNVYTPVNTGKLNYNIVITEDDYLYMYIPVNEKVGTNYPNAKVYINGVFYKDYLTKYSWNTLCLGKYNKGDTINVTIEFTHEIIMDDIYFYYENLDIFNNHYNILKENEVKIKKTTSSNILGTISLEDSSYILFTIPYDKGFECLIDGKHVNIESALDSLIAVKVESGTHEIELIYNPPGLKLGIYISLGTLILTTCYLICKKRTK